jgi:hypothetical protein
MFYFFTCALKCADRLITITGRSLHVIITKTMIQTKTLLGGLCWIQSHGCMLGMITLECMLGRVALCCMLEGLDQAVRRRGLHLAV